jgi:putative transposase
LGIAPSKFHDWRNRYGLANEHNSLVPRDWWLEDGEKQAILTFHADPLLDGSRRLSFLRLDADVVAVSPSSVYRVLRDAGLMTRHSCKPSLKGKGFDQPEKPHQHWHVDFAYSNVAGTFFFLCTLLDGSSRFVVHGEIRAHRTEADVETILQRAGRRKVPRRAAADHLGQRPAVRGQGLQGVHQDLRYDACENIGILSAKQR